MFADFIKNKIPERALINQGVDFYLKYYNWPQIEKLLIEGIGKENKKAIDDINNEINKLRNKKNLNYLKKLVKTKSETKDNMGIIFSDFKMDNKKYEIKSIQKLRYLAVKYINNVMKLQSSTIIQKNKYLKVKNIQKDCRGSDKKVHSCVRKTTKVNLKG